MKRIKLEEHEKQKLIEEFARRLNNISSDGRITIDINNKLETKQKAILRYTTEAFAKMLLLVSSFSSEVGWYGLAQRAGEREFVISDIIVYKQTVSGATVDQTDKDAFEFYRDMPDEMFNEIRYQGHSHVNMGTTPSSTDIKNFNDLSQTSEGKGFYIFQIWNKSLSYFVKIYDYENGIVYEEEDVEIEIGENNSLRNFLEKAKEDVHPAYKKTETKKKETKTTKAEATELPLPAWQTNYYSNKRDSFWDEDYHYSQQEINDYILNN